MTSFRVLGFVALLALAGCVRQPEAEADRRMRVVDREREPERLLARAEALAQIGDYTRAEQYLQAARASGASERAVLPLLIRVCMHDQRYRAAVQHVEEYLRKHPSQYPVRFVLATLYAGLGEAESARRELERVVAEAPRHAEAHFALAMVLRQDLGNYRDADRHFRAYLELAPRGPHVAEAESALMSRLP
jgi:tetratricopeptide (TPR) repeat protein